MFSRVCVSRVTEEAEEEEEQEEEGEEEKEAPSVRELRPGTGGRGIQRAAAAAGEAPPLSAVPPRMRLPLRRGRAGSAPGSPRSPGGSTSCWSGVPPGLNPLAAVDVSERW